MESAKSGDGALDEHEQIWGMFGQDHVRLLYLIYCYTMIQVRKAPLRTLLYLTVTLHSPGCPLIEWWWGSATGRAPISHPCRMQAYMV